MENIAKLLEKPMDRKDFLRHVGLGFALLLGGNMIVRTIFGLQKSSPQASGYGASPYGGIKR